MGKTAVTFCNWAMLLMRNTDKDCYPYLKSAFGAAFFAFHSRSDKQIPFSIP
jgi:L-cystine uptake protein TcyP (sodium:dicarboxylate symporter family)